MRNELLIFTALVAAWCCSTLAQEKNPLPDEQGDADRVVIGDTLKARIRGLKKIRSVGGVTLAGLNLNYVRPHRDRKTGFVVGGSNSTKTILSLDSINGIDIDALERQMRPGAPGETGSEAGFLGPDESLLRVMADDNRFVVEQQGLTHQDLARPLLLLGYFARRQRDQQDVTLGDMTFTVRAVHYMGSQYSPFEDRTSTSTDVTVVNKRTGHGLTFSPLVPLMIERYGFYEGKGTSYRVDPALIIDLFRAEKSPRAHRHPRLPFKPITDHELKQALALAEPSALTELNLSGGEITDAGIVRLSEFENLQELSLAGTGITDQGLAGCSHLTNLKTLNLSGTKVTDKGLSEIGQLPNLTTLYLFWTPIGDAGLKQLSALTKLTRLNLRRTEISDEGLAALSGLTSLQVLGLDETKVTDEGLKALLPLKSLTKLSLVRSTGVTDKGLLLLSRLPSLETVNTHGTKVTRQGSKEFERRLRERSAAD